MLSANRRILPFGHGERYLYDPIGHSPCVLAKYSFRYRAKTGSDSDSGTTELLLATGGSMLLTLVSTWNVGCASLQMIGSTDARSPICTGARTEASNHPRLPEKR